MKTLCPGLEIGMLISYDNEWAKIIQEGDQIGIKWCFSDVRQDKIIMGVGGAALSKERFHELWKIAGAGNCPKVPEELSDYIPPNNQGRKFCFWHKYTETKEMYVKEIDRTFNYCPICQR